MQRRQMVVQRMVNFLLWTVCILTTSVCTVANTAAEERAAEDAAAFERELEAELAAEEAALTEDLLNGGGDETAVYDDIDVEEYSFESPSDVHDAWKQSLEEMKADGERIISELPEHFTFEEALAHAFNKTTIELKFNETVKEIVRDSRVEVDLKGKAEDWQLAVVTHVDRGFHRVTTYDVRLDEEQTTTDRFGRTKTSKRVDDLKKTQVRDVGKITRRQFVNLDALEIPLSCLQGRQSCLHADTSPLKERAEEEAKAHLSTRPQEHSQRLQAALLPSLASPDVIMGQLAAPPAGWSDARGDTSAECDAEDESCQEAQAGGLLALRSVKAYAASLAVVDSVVEGKLANIGVVPSGNVSEWVEKAAEARERHGRRKYGRDSIDVAWRTATEYAERTKVKKMLNRTAAKANAFPNEMDDTLRTWFEEKGGEIRNAVVREGRAGRRVLKATTDFGVNENEDVGNATKDDYVLRIPFRLTLNKITMRNVGLECKGRCSFLSKHFKSVFEKKEEWGLATLLLHEHAKGNESRWYPFVRTLRMHMLRKNVLQELEGTFAAELSVDMQYRLWDVEADAMVAWMNEETCKMDHKGIICNFGKTRKDYRWALGAVRRFAFNLTKRTSGKSFLALVPYGNLLEHKRGAGGKATLELDNTIQIAVNGGTEGATIAFERGQLSDAQCMLRYFRVDPEANPHTQVRLLLPGAQGERDHLSSFFFRRWRSTMEDWRRQMKYPPKLSELWKSAKELNLYGYKDDEDEERFLTHSGNGAQSKQAQQIIGALPLPQSEASAEEQLELMGWANDENHASLLLTGTTDVPEPLLYTPEMEENPHADNAVQDLSDAAMQLQEAVAAGHTDSAVLSVINHSIAFFEHGIAPPKGLDEIDRLLMRKRNMMQACGPTERHSIFWSNISEPLFCAVRVTVMNETDVDVLCPKAKGPWDDSKCEDGIFKPLVPVSPANELAMIQALNDTIIQLISEMRGSDDEDAAILALSDMSIGPARRSAIILRQREKTLLRRAMAELGSRVDDVHDLEYQLLDAIAERNRRDEARAQRQLAVQEIMEEYLNAKVVQQSVDFGATIGKVNFTVTEGQDLNREMQAFARRYGVSSTDAAKLEKSVRSQIRPARRVVLADQFNLGDGRRATFVVWEGDNITQSVRKFFAIYNTTLETEAENAPNVTRDVTAAVERREALRLIMSMNVAAPDGRSLLVEVREGEQHDLWNTMAGYATAFKLPSSAVQQIVDAVWQKLPPAVFVLPIGKPDGSGETLQLRVTSSDLQEDNLINVVDGFCKSHGLPEENGATLAKAVHRGMYAAAVAV